MNIDCDQNAIRHAYEHRCVLVKEDEDGRLWRYPGSDLEVHETSEAWRRRAIEQTITMPRIG